MIIVFFFFQAEDGIRDYKVTGVQTCALPICLRSPSMPESFVAKAADMQDGDRRIVVSGRHEIGVFFKDGAYYAYSNYCVHAGGPACEGVMVNKVVDIIASDRTYEGQTFSDELHFVCPWHGYEYD